MIAREMRINDVNLVITEKLSQPLSQPPHITRTGRQRRMMIQLKLVSRIHTSL